MTRRMISRSSTAETAKALMELSRDARFGLQQCGSNNAFQAAHVANILTRIKVFVNEVEKQWSVGELASYDWGPLEPLYFFRVRHSW